jgi:hypothetical protein
MKKYITTSKHPELKEGVLIDFNGFFDIDGWTIYNKDLKIESWLEKGYIKRLEEKEFTKSDMIDFVDWFDDNHGESKYISWPDCFDLWLKSKKNNTK